MPCKMRPKVALKLLLITIGASLVAYILTSATRPHPHVTCTGPLCEEAVQQPKEPKSDNVQLQVKQEPNLQVNLDEKLYIKSKDAEVKNIGQASENSKKEEEIDEIQGDTWVNVEIGAFEGTGSEDNIDNRFDDLDQIVERNDRDAPEQDMEVKSREGDIIVDGESDNTKSFLEKIGVIQKDKNPKILDEKKDLYSWKMQGAFTKDKSLAVRLQNNGQDHGDEEVRSETDKDEAGKDHGILLGNSAPAKSVLNPGSEDAESNNGNGGKNSDPARVGLVQNDISGIISANNGENAILQKGEPDRTGKAVNLKTLYGVGNTNSANKTSVVENNETKPSSDAQAKATGGKTQSIQGVLRAAASNTVNLSSSGTSFNHTGMVKNPLMAKNPLRRNDTANQSANAQPGENTGDLLLKAGVIIDRKNKHNTGDMIDHSGQKLNKNEVEPDSSEIRQEKRRLCVEFLSGTGNILFQFASAYAIAKDRNMTLTIPEHIPKFSDAFDIVGGVDDTISFDQSRCQGAVEAANFKRGVYDGTFLKRLPEDADIKLKGYFQSFKYFEGYEEDVRDILSFKDDVTTKAMEAINVLHFRKFGKSLHDAQTSQAIVLVGVHVRRHPISGRQSTRQEEGYRVADHDYIQRAIMEMRNRHSGRENNSAIRFYVVSDDEAWAVARLGIKDSPDTILVTGLTWAPTLALLANMDHVITTVGALGWWGAWLADGDVIYYQNFLEPGSKMDSAYLVSDFFPSSWTPML